MIEPTRRLQFNIRTVIEAPVSHIHQTGLWVPRRIIWSCEEIKWGAWVYFRFYNEQGVCFRSDHQGPLPRDVETSLSKLLDDTERGDT